MKLFRVRLLPVTLIALVMVLGIRVNNLFDEVYEASRAPRGTFPGAERHFFVGLEFDGR